MPIGVYIRTEEHKRKIKEAYLKKPFSHETRKKMSIRMSGTNNPMYAKYPSDETRKKMCAAKTGKNNPMYGKHWSNEIRQKMSDAQRGKKLSGTHIKNMSTALTGRLSPMKGKHLSEEHKKKISVAHCGKHLSKEHRSKLRVAALKRVLRDGIQTAIGRNEKMLLDTQEQIDSVTILRQYPIQTLGYIVDGYCPKTNTIYEVYENFHDRTVYEDLERETEICNFLSCDFIIIWDRSH